MAQETITTISPSTNTPVVERKGPTETEFKTIPQQALQAFKSFSTQTTLHDRQKIVKRALELLRERKDELGQEITQQMGRPINYTAGEVATAALRGEYMLRVSDECLADTPGDAEQGFQRYIRKVPLGPVLILFPWNYPYLTLVNSLVPAILAGNSVVIKPSPQTPTSAEQAQRIFEDAGLPKGVIQVVHCGSFDRLEALIKAPEFRLVCFTGSVAGGLAVQKAVSDQVDVRVGLELGGNDPAYVRADVDPKWAAAEIVDGCVFNSGQSCCALERVYVDSKIHDAFVEAVQDELRGYKLGDPTDKATNVGPVISKRSKETILAQIHDALTKGAKDVTPDNSTFKAPPPGGNYVAPVVLTGCTHSMEVMTEETFGPVIPIMKVGSDEEAIELMNDSKYGLTASIWTKDTAKGHQLAEDVEAGTVFVNRADYPAPDLAWTGWKNSGKGQTLSKFGFDQFVRLKNFHVKNYPN